MKMHPATRALVWSELSAVLFKHYADYIREGSNPDAMTAWAIMQDVRKHLGIKEGTPLTLIEWMKIHVKDFTKSPA